MSGQYDRAFMPIPDDDGAFPYEVWKDGEFFRPFLSFEDAKAVCDRGNNQTGNFQVKCKDEIVWPIKNP